MSRSSVPRVYLGKPYNREFWWSTARRILNQNHRGKHDHKFTRHQKLPDAAGLHKPNAAYMVGGAGTEHVKLEERLKYTQRLAV